MQIIQVIYEDEYYLAVNKPEKVLVHHSHYSRNIEGESLVSVLRKQYKETLAPVNRLDYGTSGIVVFSKNPEFSKKFQKMSENGEIKKIYYALVRGFTDIEGLVDTPIKEPDSNNYKEAKTFYNTVEQKEIDIAVEPFSKSRYSIIELRPVSGRMHQLRKHMNKISHPIIGDKKYGNRHHNRMFENDLDLNGMFLHAKSLNFFHPYTMEETSIIATFPDKWKNMSEKLGLKNTF